MDANFVIEPKPPKRQKTLVVDVGDLKEPWLAWCESQGVKPSQAVREVIAKLIAAKKNPPASIPVTKASRFATEDRGTTDTERVRLQITLTGSEGEFASKLAEAAGFSVPKWLGALVRHQLTGEPQLGQVEQEAVAESNYQLLAIGRNLNQIAKSLNTSPEDRRVYNVEAIEELRETIHRHVEKMSRVLESNTERWKLL